MRTRSKLLALGALSALAFAGSEARAQNTYADVPFNQGSLFYRPSGARPPQTTRSTRPFRLFRRNSQPATNYYYSAPGATNYSSYYYSAPAAPTYPGYYYPAPAGTTYSGYAPAPASNYGTYYYPQVSPRR